MHSELKILSEWLTQNNLNDTISKAILSGKFHKLMGSRRVSEQMIGFKFIHTLDLICFPKSLSEIKCPKLMSSFDEELVSKLLMDFMLNQFSVKEEV